MAALVASLALSGLAAWWPVADDSTGLLPAPRTAGRVSAAPGPATAADPDRAPVPPVSPVPTAPPVPVPVPATPTSPLAVPAAPSAAAAAAPTATLPTRPADWPEPGAAALAAWQGALPVRPAASASAAAAANPAAPATAPLPVFPYQWIGQLDDGGPPQVLLASGQRSVGVRQGAVVDGRWRLDRAPGEPWKATHLPSGVVVSVRGAPSAGEP